MKLRMLGSLTLLFCCALLTAAYKRTRRLLFLTSKNGARQRSWDGKEIYRGDGFPMIVEKGRPSLGRLRILRRSPHPARHGSLRKIETKHFQFAVDARCAPCGVLRNRGNLAMDGTVVKTQSQKA